MVVLFKRQINLSCRREYFRVFCIMCEEMRPFLQPFPWGKGDAWSRTGTAASPADV